MPMISVCLSGPRCHRQPFAYPALAPLFAGALRFVARPQAADVVLFGHPDDLVAAAPGLAAAPRPAGQRVVYLSEEPFWDTVGPVPPFAPRLRLETDRGPLPVHVLTHGSTDIFDFDRIPYFLLTDARFVRRYRACFRANRRMSGADWRAHFATVPLRAAFMAENRLSPKLDKRFPEHGVWGLCSYRTELAIRCRSGPVLRAGRGWPAGAPDRVALPDWHRDKMRRLFRQCLLLSALENTHQRNYVSEKIFDAFALGAVPLYLAAPGHAVHRVAAGGWINLHGLCPAEAAAALADWRLTAEFLDRYRAAQAKLADLFDDSQALEAERARLGRALLSALEAVLEAGS